MGWGKILQLFQSTEHFFNLLKKILQTITWSKIAIMIGCSWEVSRNEKMKKKTEIFVYLQVAHLCSYPRLPSPYHTVKYTLISKSSQTNKQQPSTLKLYNHNLQTPMFIGKQSTRLEISNKAIFTGDITCDCAILKKELAAFSNASVLVEYFY